MTMGILPNAWSSTEWTTWATNAIVTPIKTAVKNVAEDVSGAIFNPFQTHLPNLRFV